ncbi:hypothetical protein SAMN02745857_02730 [Andreprevotia lacus DSM 23236]|jgi:predicted N-acyltransferase|uniref:Uncharacterized protein n=1 Tax=Andreprevotia lacus DSM 23236 TaxID=1121001 RepID=A0A1W1XT92_9NEIS|nr:GNAT family N-acetyltransferase [Andreprevotia lacus]SMC27107.1 hypothetical protein SAMN02745857_02730 [Andreprevotia lacus DSM 23236]
MLRVHTDLSTLPPAQWNALAGASPVLNHAFLAAMEAHGCVGRDSGWQPCHIALHDGAEDGPLRGALPLYLKQHSYGEYVFDWSWAQAYHEHGLDYYPKLLGAIPFTPVPGERLLADSDADRSQLIQGALALARDVEASSLHLLFHPQRDIALLQDLGLQLRTQIQFHWRNQGWADFDAFLAALKRDKRKKIRQERNKVTAAGIRIERKVGHAITAEDWAFFARCYSNTYHEHRSSPYLNEGFFRQIGQTLPEACLLIMAYRNDEPLACALNLIGPGRLYGRYWGADWEAGGGGFEPNLHFELCYYQGIEFALERGIAVFEGGAQGEHKQARGFSPVMTYSAHWLAHPGFARAVAEYLRRERTHIERAHAELLAHEAFGNAA